MVDLVSMRETPHEWKIYDERHRSCVRCGLRLVFFRGNAYGASGWTLITGDGVMISHVLADSSESWGRCEPPTNTSVELVIVEYTGDPDQHPGCERFMHRVQGGEVERGRGGPGLVALDAFAPACGWRPMFWEVAPARLHPGWTLCGDVGCFPGKGPRAADCHEGRRRHAGDWDPGPMRPRGAAPRELGPGVRRLPAPKPKALPPKKKR